MTEADWLACEDPLPLLTFLRDDADKNKRRLQLFVCAACRRFWPLLGETGLQHVLEISERDADGYSDVTETQNAANVAFGLVRNLPKIAPSYPVSSAAAWSTVANCNRNFAESAIRELMFLSGRWASLKSLIGRLGFGTHKSECLYYVRLVRDIFGNPFRPVAFSPEWRTDTALALARQMYESRDFIAMPILADARQDAGCDGDDILNHCRNTALTHIRACWVVDLVLGRE